ncbi:MAG: transcription termination/antitermination protein NusA [Oscillospiraceae bacterium]|nr:transcription termination/antitermination protein NusA [Candidatus Equicaccousia limihippi]
MNKEFFEALRIMEEEKGVDQDFLCEKISGAIVTALRKSYGESVFCDINREKQTLKVYAQKTVVETVEDEFSQMSLEEAKTHKKTPKIGDTIKINLDPKKFGRIIAQTAKHVIRQGIREGERSRTLEEFQSKNHELVTAVIDSIDPVSLNANITIGTGSAVLPRSEQVPDEVLSEGDHIKVYIVDVKDSEKGPRPIISRTHPGLVKRLFELEVPEIEQGLITIKSVSRQAGARTKLAVYSDNEELDAVGACIGQRGERVNQIVEELGGEKIDIVRYSDDPVMFVSEALSPAKVVSVEILENTEDGKPACRATVPDGQLSLAIGNKGQNVRLAARLTGYKIDIRPESGYFGEDDED